MQETFARDIRVMKNFYILKGGIPCKETKNIYPQVLRPLAPKNSVNYNIITDMSNKPNPTAKGLVIELELDPKTNPTDFISQSYIDATGLLVSQRMFEFLSGFNIQPNMEIYKSIIHHKGEKFDYVWINPTLDYDIDINFSKTSFFLFDYLEDKKTPIAIKDEKDLNKKRLAYNPTHFIVVDELFINNDKVLELDLFFLSIGSMSIRCSEKLKQELEKKGFTAFKTNPALKFSV